LKQIKCFGCGALVDDIEGRPHEYIGASQGCWDLYSEVLAKEYAEYEYFEDTNRLTVDTYAIQHPGERSRRSIQSVNGHLISLYCVLIKGFSGKTATKLLGEILASDPGFTWLEPPVPNGRITVVDVLNSTDKEEHRSMVREWAQDVFDCWYLMHKDTIERLVRENLMSNR